jgi:phosphatidate cytidylyltransferase
MNKALKQRLTIAFPIVALLIYIIFYQPTYFFVVISLIVLRTLWEFFNLYKNTQKSFSKSAILYSILFMITVWKSPQLFELMLIIGVILFLSLQIFDKSNTDGMKKISLTVCGFIYITVFSSYVFKIYIYKSDLPMWGPTMVFWTFFICKFSDATAYFGGVNFGKHKMIPRLSPNKSWEGFFFGLLGGVAPALLIQSLDGFNLSTAFQFCLLVTLAAVGGDFIESMFKRELKVKDAANDIPAFGGTFDMIDSVITSLPIAYLFIHFKVI